MNFNTRILIYISIFLVASKTGISQTIQAIPAPNGIWVNAKEIFTPGNNIIISRKDGNNNAEIATLAPPSSLEAFRTAYQDVVIEQTSGEFVADSTLAVVWTQFNRYNRIDSLGLYAGNFHILA